MSEVVSELPFHPIFWQENPNDEIVLGEYNVSVCILNKKFSLKVNASLRFLPTPRLRFTCPATHSLFWTIGVNQEMYDVEFPSLGTKFECSCGISKTEASFSPRNFVVQLRKPSDRIRKVVFHLFNWPDISSGEDIRLEKEQSSKRIGHTKIVVSSWKIEILATEKTSNSISSLRQFGGHQITHIGTVEHEDGTDFKTNEADEVLERLGMFFEFVLGRRSDPSLCFGYDVSGNCVYEQIGIQKHEDGAWKGHSWFHEMNASWLKEVFPGFWSLCDRQPWWKKQLINAIYWYSHANMGVSSIGIDSALIFSQAALEMLAWNYCCHERKAVSKDAFTDRGGLRASDKLRLLASLMGIPTEIPSESKHLHQMNPKYEDSMHVITAMRNDLVHPDVKREPTLDEYHEAWQLSMWYLDLVLLKLCGHRGQYHNRISGKIETVPWVTNP